MSACEVSSFVQLRAKDEMATDDRELSSWLLRWGSSKLFTGYMRAILS